ncbi:zinc knuckle CX2CX4HX4C containing protein [Tanacetum coccineum]
MSNRKQNEKRQVRVPIKLEDSNYGTLNVKNKKNKKNKKLNDDVLCNDGLENRNDGILGNMDECQTGVNEEVVREDNGEIKIKKESGDVVVSGMDHVSDEYANTDLRNRHGEDSGEKVCDDNCVLDKVHMDMNKEDLEILSPSISETITGACKSPTNSNQKEVAKKTIQTKIDESDDNGAWMVNNKPLVLQKWNINMCIDKIEPNKLPLWVKLRNIPLEAWTINGIISLASRIRKPLIMDDVTASICKLGVGRIDFVRVLVEVQAKKGLPDKIEVVYKNAHKGMNQDVKADDFIEVVYKRNVKQQVNKNFKPSLKSNVTGGMNVKIMYKPVNDKNGKREENNKDNKSEPYSRMEKIVKLIDPNEKKSIGKNKVNATEIQKTNKFSILIYYEEDDLVELNGMANREKVDSFLRMKIQPAMEEMRDWNDDMRCYFKETWKSQINRNGNDDDTVELEDIYTVQE